jgi:hypothetical protein
VHQHQANAERGEQVEVMNEGEEARALGKELAAEGHDERAPAKGVHVRRDLAQPADERFGREQRSHCIFFKLYEVNHKLIRGLCFAPGGSP